MGEPPNQLDGADVLCWVVSRRGGFYQQSGSDPPITVSAMAVARYADGGPFYLFKCDAGWQVFGDWDCGSVEEARELAAEHSFGEPLEWRQRPNTRPVHDNM
jgi:hypothetical protein